MAKVRMVVGLCNPGPRFVCTRHNLGFMVVDHLVEKLGGKWVGSGAEFFDSAELTVREDGCEIIAIKPKTYMNSSGSAVREALEKYNLEAEELLVVHDDINREVGRISLKFGGSAGGHNGIRSIISRVGSNFYRLRVGIGRPPSKEDVASYVLECFSEEETPKISAALQEAVELILKFLNGEIDGE